jgi:hypothetical protein
MWATVDDGLDVARQNGKGVVLQADRAVRGVRARLPGRDAHRHEFATCQEHMYRLMGFIQDCDHLDARVKGKGGYKTANGQESINLRVRRPHPVQSTDEGRRPRLLRRPAGVGRGDVPADVGGRGADADAARQQSEARPEDHLCGVGGRPGRHPHGVPFARVRERGIAQDPRVSWHEWSAPLDDLKEFNEDMLHDRAWWRLANPSMADGLIAEDTMADEIAGMPLRQAAVELFGIGDWPRTDGFTDTIISLEAWNALENPESRLQKPYVLALDMSPERRTSIALAGRNQDGDFHAELQESRDGTGWVVARIVEMVANGKPTR